MSVLKRIQDAIRTEQYELTVHALEEAEDDDFTIADIEHAILDGSIVRKYTHDPRGTRYEIRGSAEDGRTACVLCRFCERTGLLVITVFAEIGE